MEPKKLMYFFNPRTIAVIGASHTPGKVGYAILENLKASFKGKIYPVNPKGGEILGLKVYRSVLEIEDSVDLAIIAVKAQIVENVLEECGKKGVKAVVIISAGFKEVGNVEGEERIKEIIEKYEMRALGPNCIGIYDTFSGVDTLFSDVERVKKPGKGNIGFISQSGALGLALIDKYAEMNVGISKFASIGNKVDVDETELVDFFGKDENVRVISLYIEGVEDGKRFMEIAKNVVREKPIVCLKGGKTEKGKAAVSSHTGAMAGNYEVYSAAFRQAGIIEARDLEELMNFTKVLASQPPMKGKRIAIVTNGGGFGIIAADQAVLEGLELASFSENTITKLREAMPEHAVIGNPLDLTGDATSERYAIALKAVMEDENVDGVCIICLLQLATVDRGIVNVLESCKKYGKPFVVCAGGSAYSTFIAKELQKNGIPVYLTPHRAIKALRVLYEYERVLRKFKR